MSGNAKTMLAFTTLAVTLRQTRRAPDDLTASVDLQKHNALIIYCKRFHPVFGVARPEPF